MKNTASYKLGVIILDEEKSSNTLVRCIDSILNQTYKNIEIFCFSDTQSYKPQKVKYFKPENKVAELNNIFASTPNDYILFMPSTSVFSPKGIYLLLEEYSMQNVIAEYLVFDNNNNQFLSSGISAFNIYGKLFPTTKLRNYRFTTFSLSEQISFLAEILTEKYNVSEKVFIYDDGRTDTVIYSILEKFLSEKNSYVINYLTLEVIMNILKTKSDTCQKLDFITYITQITNNIYLMYQVSLSFVLPLWENYLKRGNYSLYEAFQKYFFSISTLPISKIFWDLFTLDDIDIELLKVLNSKEFIQLYNARLKPSVISSYNKTERDYPTKEINIKLNSLANQIENLSKTATKEIYIGSNYDDLQGTELVNFVLNKYQNGNLGFRTIINSFKNWLKYKIHQKGV